MPVIVPQPPRGGQPVDPNALQQPTAAPPQIDQQAWLGALDAASAEIAAEQQQQIDAGTLATTGEQFQQQHGLPSITPQWASRLGGAITAGANKAIFETKDFLVGEPNYDQKSSYRQMVERDAAILDRQGMGYQIAGDIGQFAAGMLGTGKITGSLKAAAGAGKAASWAIEAGRGAFVGATVFDPHEERLSNLIQAYPSLSNPVTAYLAADPGDSAAEGRLKSAIESIGLDAGLSAVFAASVRVLRYARAGDATGVEKATAELDKLTKENAATINKDASKAAPGPNAPPPSGAVVDAPSPSASPDAANPLAQFDAGSNGGTAALSDAASQQAARDNAAAFVQQFDPNAKPKVAPAEAATLADAAGTVTKDASKAKPDLVTPEPLMKHTEGQKPLSNPKAIPEADIAKLIDAADTKAIDTGAAWGGKAPGNIINWSRLEQSATGPTDVSAYIQKAATVLEDRFNKIKGGDILSDATVNRRVVSIAETFGSSPADVLGEIRTMGKTAPETVAKAEAGFLIGQSIMADAKQLATKVKYGMLDEFGGNADVAMKAVVQRLTLGLDAMAQAQSIVSNSARLMRRQRKEFLINPRAIEGLKKLDPQALVEAIYHAQDPKELQRLGTEGWAQRLIRKIGDTGVHLLVNGPLWWWPTHVVNLTSSVLMLGLRPLELMVGSLPHITDGVGAAMRKQALREFRYTASSTIDGLSAALDAFVAGDSVLMPHESFFMQAAASGDRLPFRPFNSVDNLIYNALAFSRPNVLTGLPTRALGAADEAVKTIRYRAVIQARAAGEADRMGLTGQAATDLIAQRLKDSVTPDGRAVDAAAEYEAKVTTFTQPLATGSLGATIQGAVANHPYLLRPVFTYVRTPINVVRYSWKMTPFLNFAQTEFRQAFLGAKGVEEQAHAYGQLAIGTLITGYAATLASSGMLTGAGPSDFKLRKELMATGWRPYSLIYENRDGTKSYYPIGRLEPLGMIFGMAADIADIQAHPERAGQAQDLTTAMATAIINNITNKTFLMSVQQTIRALADPEKSFGKFAGGTLNAMIPGSALLRGANPDPYLREARTLVDNALGTMPGYSATLPPQRDLYGNQVIARRGLWADQGADPVEREIQRIVFETGQGFVPPNPVRDGVDFRDITTEDGRTAYDRLQEYGGHPGQGMSLKDALRKVIASEGYRKAIDGDAGVRGTKSDILGTVIQKYRDAGYRRLLAESEVVREAVNQKKMDVASAYRNSLRAQAQQTAATKQAVSSGADPLGTLLNQLQMK